MDRGKDAPPDEFAAYLPHVRRRWLAQQQAREQRRAEALEAARRVAELLQREFGAEAVFAYGSVVHAGHFDERSDLDLAVAGVASEHFFKAWAAAAAACPFELDLVDLADCSPSLRQRIDQEGVSL